VLSSQRSKKNDGTIATYPDSIIARLVGSRGDGIKKLQDESGADTWYRIRYEYPNYNDEVRHMGVSLNGGTPKTPQNDHF